MEGVEGRGEGRSYSACGNRVNHPSPTTNHVQLSFEFTQPMSRHGGVQRDCHRSGNNDLSGASARRFQVGNLRNYRSAQGHVMFFLNFHFSHVSGETKCFISYLHAHTRFVLSWSIKFTAMSRSLYSTHLVI